jgi:beta-glucosidase
VHAPGIKDFMTAVGVSHHLLLAHRNAADALRAAHRDARVGIALNLSPADPASDSQADVDAASRMDGYLNRWFLDPLFGRGYPKDMLELYAPYFDRGSELAGYDGALDFLGVNYYTRRVVRAGGGPLQADRIDPDGEHTAIGWEVHPASFRKLLVRVHRDYAPRHMYITENGAAYDDEVKDDRVDDPARVAFLERHFGAAAEAIAEGVPLRGYFIWTLMDNFEWSHGTSKRFGIVHTDYRTQRRRVKTSGEWYRGLIAAHRAARATAAAK